MEIDATHWIAFGAGALAISCVWAAVTVWAMQDLAKKADQLAARAYRDRVEQNESGQWWSDQQPDTPQLDHIPAEDEAVWWQPPNRRREIL